MNGGLPREASGGSAYEMIKRPDRFLPTLRGGNEAGEFGLLSAIPQSRRANERK